MSFEIEKRKHKDGLYQGDQTPTNSILTFLGIKPLQFEFVVDLPLDECKERLEAQRKVRGFWDWLFGGCKITVEVRPIGAEASEFKLVKMHPKHLDLLMRGSLNQISNYTTLVSGKINCSLSLRWIFYFIAMAIWIGILGILPVWVDLSNPYAWLWLICVTFIWLLPLLLSKWDRDAALERFEETMTAGYFAKPKRKRTSFA